MKMTQFTKKNVVALLTLVGGVLVSRQLITDAEMRLYVEIGIVLISFFYQGNGFDDSKDNSVEDLKKVINK